MYTIHYSVSQQLLRGTPWYPVAGTVGKYRAVFEFSPEWSGLTKVAVFRSGTATTEQLLDGDGSCIVPWEPLQEQGWLEVGVYGVDGETRLPTYWDMGVPIAAGPGKSDPAQEPSPDKWQQYIDQVKDTIPDAVSDYLDEHPVTVTEVDPTVPSWAKQPTKPTYTAAEVGALPKDTEIPTVPKKVSAFENDAGYLKEHQNLDGYAKKTDIPSTLPNPQKLTFTGGASGSYDGSEAVTINIPEGGSSGGSALPESTTEDAGKFLRVNEGGAPAWEAVESAEGTVF